MVLILFSSVPLGVQAEEIKYNHNSITIPEIKKKVDFTVLTPQKTPDDWTLEIKTYPTKAEENFTYFRLHYMDKNDKYLMVGIEERKETSNKEKPLSPYTEVVDISGNTAYFEAWGNSGEVDKNGDILTGGLLNWIQDGTSVEIISFRLSKEQMLEIARSMK